MQIHLLEGFYEDEVRVRIAGSEQRLAGVSTGTRLGLARTLDVAVASELVEVDIALPERGLSSSVTVSHASEASVCVNVTEAGKLELTTSLEPLHPA